MWDHVDGAEPVLLLRVRSREQRVFTFSLDQISGGGLAPVSAPDKDYEIDAQTQRLLTDLLRSLLEKPDARMHSLGFARLGQLLFTQVLPDWVQKPLDSHLGPVVVQASDVGIPWELLHNGREFLCLRKPVSRRLAEADFAVRPTGAACVDGRLRALIVADPEDNLSSARQEAAELKEVFGEAGVETVSLIGSRQARWDVVLEHLGARRPDRCYQIVHFSGHIREQALEGGLSARAFALANGQFLSHEHVVRGFGCPNALVFINACFGHPLDAASVGLNLTARMGQGRSMVSAFLSSGGCKGVVGTMWWVLDRVARNVSTGFYRDILNGATVGDALMHVRQHVAQTGDPSLWAGYTHYGDPRLSLLKRAAPPSAAGARDGLTTPPVPVEKMCSLSPSGVHVDPLSVPEPFRPPAPNAQPAAADVPQAAAATPSLQAPASEAVLPPLDDSGRLALVNAFHEQQAMQWPELSTIHLLVGLMLVPSGAMSQLLAPMEIPMKTLVVLLEKGLQQERDQKDAAAADASHAFGMRANVLEVLQAAHARVQIAHRSAVGEDDILDAILEKPDCGAFLILNAVVQAAGHDLGKLVASRRQPRASVAEPASKPPVQTPPEPAADSPASDVSLAMPKPRFAPFLANGDLDPAKVAPGLMAALELAVQEAQQTLWEDVRSPHLAMGLMGRAGGAVGRHAARQKIPLPTLIQVMRSALTRPDIPSVSPRLHREFMSDNAIEFLNRAIAKAATRGSCVVDEQDLWLAILEDTGGVFAQILNRLGLSPVRLLPAEW